LSAAIPAASVIVALNPHDNDLGRIFRAFDAQAAVTEPFEVIVVDSGARAGVAQACADHAARNPLTHVRYIAAGGKGRAAANNAGADAARAEFLVFVADDFIPGPTLLRAHLDFQRGLRGPGVAIGPAYFTSECASNPFRRWLEESGRLFGVSFRTAPSQWPQHFFYVGNASMTRALFERVGRFDERFTDDLVDDLEFGLRLAASGVRTHVVVDALAWHDHAVSVEERVEAMRRSGRAARALERRALDVRPWAAIVDQPVEQLRDALRVAPAQGATLQEKADYFRALVDVAFIEGYRDEETDER
jgi:GT2 family glycosyltransferase